MTRAEIRRKFDEIVAFAEVEKFLDTPVKRYSSGMYVRLAFAVAAHLEPEILVVDEVLAVGDAHFQKKCLGKMGEVTHGGRTVIFVSHNMAAVQQLCAKGVVLDSGTVVHLGPVDEAVAHYQEAIAQQASRDYRTREFPHRRGNGMVRFREVEIVNSRNEHVIRCGGDVSFVMQLETQKRVRASDTLIGLGINGLAGERIATLLSRFAPQPDDFYLEDGTTVTCTIPRLQLRPGAYNVTLYIDVNNEVTDNSRDAIRIDVQEADYFGTGVMPTSSHGPLLIDQSWHYQSVAEARAHAEAVGDHSPQLASQEAGVKSW
jgi:lipopolysaccharide transport system ATP-binding protein